VRSQEKQPPIPEHYGDDLRGLVSRLLAKDAHVRPSAKEVLSLPFIKERTQGLASTGGTIGTRVHVSKPTPRATPRQEAAARCAAACTPRPHAVARQHPRGCSPLLSVRRKAAERSAEEERYRSATAERARQIAAAKQLGAARVVSA
jgi:hypothetical protein